MRLGASKEHDFALHGVDIRHEIIEDESHHIPPVLLLGEKIIILAATMHIQNQELQLVEFQGSP